MTRLSESIVLGCVLIAGAGMLPGCTTVAGEDEPGLEESLSVVVQDIDVLKAYNADANELPEGLAVDRQGRIYLSMAFLGQIRRVDRYNNETTIAQLPTGGFAVLGVAVDSYYNVYAGDATFDPATHGVYKITPTGSISRLPGSENIGLPNGLVVNGNYLFVSDSINGKIWRIPRFGGSAAVWSESSLFLGDNSAPPPFPVGINGLAYRYGAFYATNSEMGTLLKIPVNYYSGSAGTPVVLKQDPLLGAADGLAIDDDGNFIMAVLAQSTIVSVSRSLGSVTVLADASDGIDFPSSVVFDPWDDDTLYALNFSIGPLFGAPRGAGPALLDLEVDD